MASRRIAAFFYFFSLFAMPSAVVLMQPSVAVAQVRKEPTSALGHKITSKTDEVIAIAFKLGMASLVFYGIFVAVKFVSGNGREAWPHLLYFLLGSAILASIDQMAPWILA